jgi:hypothetical protein
LSAQLGSCGDAQGWWRSLLKKPNNPVLLAASEETLVPHSNQTQLVQQKCKIAGENCHILQHCYEQENVVEQTTSVCGSHLATLPLAGQSVGGASLTTIRQDAVALYIHFMIFTHHLQLHRFVKIVKYAQ